MILLIATGLSTQAITFTAPPQASHTLISMLKARFKRAAHVIDFLFSASVFVPSADGFLMTIAERYWLFGAKIP